MTEPMIITQGDYATLCIGLGIGWGLFIATVFAIALYVSREK